MDITKILKFFPLMPAEKDTAKLVWAIVFYVVVPPIAVAILGALLAITIVLPFVVGIAGSVYTIFGIVCAILSYMGKDLNEVFAKKEETKE